MPILVAGVSHKSAPLEVRERLAALRPAEVLRGLPEAWGETVVLSTCNRFELYSAGSNGLPKGSPDPAELLRALEALAKGPLSGQSYVLEGSPAVRHLFSVSSGLDSLVIGEAEILGQVKEAYEAAKDAGRTGKVTNVLFQRALFVGKLVRSTTAVAMGHTSVASVAVDLAERIFGDLRRSRVLILGAGEMAELTAKHLVSAKIGSLTVANRTFERGAELARRFRGEAVAWEAFGDLLSTVDIVISSTGADRAVLTREMVERSLGPRRGRSLFLIDIAMPRDIEDSAGDLDGVYLYSLDDLSAVVAENLTRRRGEVERAAALVEGKTGEFVSWAAAAAAGERVPMRHAGAREARAS